ncbi:MAG TPA: glycosyl hydrolase 53 family protein [Mucilaginibacter sp.]|nr:glycosyl hydrolase 53 family protein [Mucilaginibacter sp.]
MFFHIKSPLRFTVFVFAAVTFFGIKGADAQGRRFKPKPAGVPSELQVTPYKTTMIANGKDETLITVKIIDSHGDVVPTASLPVTFAVSGDATIVRINGDEASSPVINAIKPNDTTWKLKITGSCRVIFRAGRTRGKVKFEAKGDSVFSGATEIHTVQPGTAHVVTSQKYVPEMVKGKILGADISFLPELEARGMKFSDNGKPGDAIQIMKDHGFNYIRLRIFNQPANPKGYSPGKGFCDLEHTLQMAKRIKATGMKFLLDFHYSDYWADPQQQNKPAAWVGQDFATLKKSLYDYTANVMQQLKDQGTVPDMVQVGNEINHGIVWPDGAINNLNSLAQLLYQGFRAVKKVNPQTAVMLHIALGGQNAESRFFLDNMAKRNVPFDVIGLSYYPKWHGTLTDLKNNMADLAKRYNKQVMVAEYSQLKQQVNDIAFTAPGNKALGSFIWEPLSTWEGIFDHDGKANKYMDVYPAIAKKYVEGK